MRIRSIKAAFRFFIALIVLLTAMAVFDNVVERIMAREMEKLHAFIGYEKTFAELILEERVALGNSSAHPRVVELYASFVLLIAVLAHLGRRIRREFRRLVSETQRIQGDIDYRISIHPDNFSEFKVVYHAMNAMADTIKQQVDDLEEARTQAKKGRGPHLPFIFPCAAKSRPSRRLKPVWKASGERGNASWSWMTWPINGRSPSIFCPSWATGRYRWPAATKPCAA